MTGTTATLHDDSRAGEQDGVQDRTGQDHSPASPPIPDTVGHWFRDVVVAAGVDATIKSMRHCNATQMLTGGIDLRTAAARPGQGAGVI